jgi:hypothetical protein
VAASKSSVGKERALTWNSLTLEEFVNQFFFLGCCRSVSGMGFKSSGTVSNGWNSLTLEGPMYETK